MLSRRDTLKLISASLAYPTIARSSEPRGLYFGAMRPSKRSNSPRFWSKFSTYRSSSQESDGTYLWHYLQNDIGKPIKSLQQGEEGDCVAQASARGCSILAAINRHLLRLQEPWLAESDVTMIYAGSRNEIGERDPDLYQAIRGRGGSFGSWAAKYLKEYGTLHQLPYSIGGNSIDLSNYDWRRSREYRDKGVPDWLEPTARKHPVQEVTNVKSGREALDAVSAGNVVLICSSYQPTSVRDHNGFSRLYTSDSDRWWNLGSYRKPKLQWWHAMLLAGHIKRGNLEGGTILNSHGPWNTGPLPYDMPEGSFNVTLPELDLMIKDWGDCYALSAYKGSDAKKYKHRLY